MESVIFSPFLLGDKITTLGIFRPGIYFSNMTSPWRLPSSISRLFFLCYTMSIYVIPCSPQSLLSLLDNDPRKRGNGFIPHRKTYCWICWGSKVLRTAIRFISKSELPSSIFLLLQAVQTPPRFYWKFATSLITVILYLRTCHAGPPIYVRLECRLRAARAANESHFLSLWASCSCHRFGSLNWFNSSGFG